MVILVTGLPRSGTSLVAGVIRACEAWTGPTIGPSPHNRKGNVENGEIRERLVKPYLERIPACPLGLRSLPIVNHKPYYTGQRWRDAVRVTITRQGYQGGPAVYKDAKIALFWRLWAAAFPEAKWVIVHRDPDAVVDSVMRAEPMMRHFADEAGVRQWHRLYTEHVDSIKADRIDVTPGDDLRGMIEWLGLTWNEAAVNDWVDWGLYHVLRR